MQAIASDSIANRTRLEDAPRALMCCSISNSSSLIGRSLRGHLISCLAEVIFLTLLDGEGSPQGYRQFAIYGTQIAPNRCLPTRRRVNKVSPPRISAWHLSRACPGPGAHAGPHPVIPGRSACHPAVAGHTLPSPSRSSLQSLWSARRPRMAWHLAPEKTVVPMPQQEHTLT